MIPAVFMVLDELPLTPSGKVARRQLPVPDYAADAAEYVAPRTPVEETLAQICAELLGTKEFSYDKSFFALGGHSLQAMQLLARASDAFDIELDPTLLFTTNFSIAELAEAVELEQSRHEEPDEVGILDQLSAITDDDN